MRTGEQQNLNKIMTQQNINFMTFLCQLTMLTIGLKEEWTSEWKRPSQLLARWVFPLFRVSGKESEYSCQSFAYSTSFNFFLFSQNNFDIATKILCIEVLYPKLRYRDAKVMETRFEISFNNWGENNIELIVKLKGKEKTSIQSLLILNK